MLCLICHYLLTEACFKLSEPAWCTLMYFHYTQTLIITHFKSRLKDLDGQLKNLQRLLHY